MTTNYQCLRGMRDLPPAQAERMQYIHQAFQKTATQYGCSPIQFPLLESVRLFQKSIGIETDIIGQEMYAFEDKNGDMIALRPEGTAGCLRSVLANGLIQRQRAKVFYAGPMFRRERPQQGRFRQFDHFGVEMYGYPSGGIDAELILMTAQVWKTLALQNITLYVNYLGSPDSRTHYRETLYQYWQSHFESLTAEEQKRAEHNPLRLLDSKNPSISTLIDQAPKIRDSLSENELRAYQSILTQLDAAGIKYVESNRLVRGLDYYSDFIFEWISSDLGAQSTICGGGRYDPLVQSMGHDIPATGFAAGVDRIEQLLPPLHPNKTNIYLSGETDNAIAKLSQAIYPHRTESKEVNIDYVPGKLKNKVKAANAYHYAAYIFDDNQIKVIDLKNDNSKTYPIEDFLSWYKGNL